MKDLLLKLREQAKEQIKSGKMIDSSLYETDLKVLVEELSIHQIELEHQNQELIQSQEYLQHSKDRYLDLFDQAPIGYLIIDSNGLIKDLNHAACLLLGTNKQALLDQKFTQIIHPDFQDIFYIFFHTIINQKKAQTCTIKIQKPNNTFFYAQIQGVRQIGLPTKDSEFRLAILDITIQKELELKQLLAKEKSEENYQFQLFQNKELEQQNERLESLLRISQFPTNSIQEILDFALSEAIQITESKIGYIYFYNEEKKQFTLNTWSKEVMNECKVMNPQTVYNLEETGCWGEAVRQSKPIVINDYQAENPHKKGTPEGHVQLNKFLTIPVFSEGKIVAVAGVANKETDYDDSDIRQLTLLLDSVWNITQRISLIEKISLAKEKVEESENRYASLLNNLEAGIVVHAADTSIVMSNPRASVLLGLSKDQMLGKVAFDPAWKFVDEKGEALALEMYPVNQIILTNQELKSQIVGVYQSKNKEVLWLTCNGFPVYNQLGEITEIVISFIDISEHKLAEEQIKLKNVELSQLNSTKDRFLSIIAHDLRGPMGGFLGLIELLEEELINTQHQPIQIQPILNGLSKSANNLFSLLNNLLEWARMQQGIVPFLPKVLVLEPFVQSILTSFLDQSKLKGIRVSINIPSSFKVLADENMLASTLRNLISNAIKFTASGGEFAILAKATADEKIEISVKDNGIGMSAEMLNNMFKLNVSISRKGTDKEASTGLGLLLCKDFIEKHGEKLWVESEEQKGSTFYFTLPSSY